jgi:hypothetical protein
MAVYNRALQPGLLDASWTHFRTNVAQSTYAKAIHPPTDESLLRFFLSCMVKDTQYEQNVV